MSGSAPPRAGRDVLQLGAGRRVYARPPGDRLVRLDIREASGPDVLWDLNQVPWPLESDSFDLIDCTDVLEHLDDLVKAMEEIHRIGRSGCTVAITTPHYSCSNSFTDPTHRQHLGLFSFDYFTGENEWSFYTAVRFRKARRDLVFHPGTVNRLVWQVARRWPAFYERRLAWILPAWFISIDLEVVK